MKKMRLILSILMATALIVVGCDDDDDNDRAETFVLVHGAWQAPYVWDQVKADLEKQGHYVIVAELPAHGSDNTPPQNTSLEVYRDAVVASLQSRSEKVILVGHSMAGMVISAVAEKSPSKIKKLIYIGAFAPKNGQSLLDLAFTDAQSQLGASLIESEDHLTLDVKRESVASLFCQDASAAVQEKVLNNFEPEPAIPFTNAVVLTEANFGSVEKYYIHTLKDNVIGQNLQNMMATQVNVKQKYSLNTGHSPFLSAPEEVTKLLLEISR